MTALERRCRWLLRAYPRWYRDERGDEMLGTLLEASGTGRSWPAGRDARAMIAGGLRVRAWPLQRPATAAALRQAVLLAAVLNLAYWDEMDLGTVRGEVGHTFPSMLSSWMDLVLGLLTLAVMAGAWFGRRTVVVVGALAAAGLWVYQPTGGLVSMAIQPVLALALVAIMALIGERLPRSWLWLAGLWYLVLVLPELLQTEGVIGAFGLWVPFGIVVGAIFWSAIDARLLLATTLAVGLFRGQIAVRVYARSGARVFPWYLWPEFVLAALPLILAGVAIWRLRRQAVL